MCIITNLVSNAIKHSHDGRILLGLRRRKQGLSIQVIDTGKGMSADQLAEQRDLQLNIQSSPGRGTCCSRDIPGVI